MDAERRDGRWHVSLGPVEKSVMGLIAAGVAALGFWLVSSVNAVLTQQAVTNTQLIAIQAQLTGIATLPERVVKLELQVEQLRQEVRDQRHSRANHESSTGR